MACTSDVLCLFPPKPPNLEIGEDISTGTYDTVYKGELDGTPVIVIKIHNILKGVFSSKGADTKSFLENFQKECLLLQKVNDPHVLRFYGAFYNNESHELMLVVESVRQTLREYLKNKCKNREAFSLQMQLQMCLEVVNGVHSLHSLVPPVIHRHLNDKNVMLTEEGVVKVGVFGQSDSRLREGNIDYFTTAQPGEIPFMPPEALKEAAHYDEKIDTFSIGVLMLEIATQQRPQVKLFGIGTVPEVKRREKDLSALGKNHCLYTLIADCLNGNSDERPDTADLKQSLQELVQNKGEEYYDVTALRASKSPVCRTLARSDTGTVSQPGGSSSTAALPKRVVPIHRMPWFHGKMTQSEAERKLSPRQNGVFLIMTVDSKTSFSRSKDSVAYRLCLCFNAEVKCYPISYKDGMYMLDGKKQFGNLKQLVEYYSKESCSCLHTRLRVPVSKEERLKCITEKEDFKRLGWDISKEKLTIGPKIADKQFAAIFNGQYEGHGKVKIKSPKGYECESLEDFLAEAAIMTSLDHPNLVQLVGVSFDQKPFYIITEFMENGSLLEYLHTRGKSVLRETYQLTFASNICNGMAYLEQRHLVHRDLKAKSTQVSKDNSTNTVIAKVSNFRLAHERDCEPLILSVAIKWTAPEALNFGDFSNKSDVWSFGILLWEIYTFGCVPYPRLVVSDTMKYVKEGGRLECPVNCPPNIYSIMKSCWHERPEDRPTFSELSDKLNSLTEIHTKEYKGKRVDKKLLQDDCNESWYVIFTDPALMISLNHPNLVKLIDVNISQKPFYIMTELMEKGSLLEYLRSGPSVVKKSHLIRFARDICSAMTYLEGKELNHTDLAARNIYLSGDSIKVSNLEYAVSGYPPKILPIRWSAPEVVLNSKTPWAPGTDVVGKHQFDGSDPQYLLFSKGDYLTILSTSNDPNWYMVCSEDGREGLAPANYLTEAFSNKSVVWSFGVVLWEMFSFGLHPYPDMTNDSVLKHIEKGGRLEYPENCPGEVWKIMESCWHEKPTDRSTFSQLYSMLANSSLLLEIHTKEYKGKRVDKKLLQDDCNESWCMIFTDPALMISLSHPNLVKLIDVNIGQKPFHLVTELMDKGSLLEYLCSGPSVVKKVHLIRFARDICSAMIYLEEKGLAHTDLAARNIYLSGDSVKVSNLELAVSGCPPKFLPIRWSAPEVMLNSKTPWAPGTVVVAKYQHKRTDSDDLPFDKGDRLTIVSKTDDENWYKARSKDGREGLVPACYVMKAFSSKSVVWSFGVILWEMFSFGLHPYSDMTNGDVIKHIESGGRLEYPKNCPGEVCKIMECCWYEKPKSRPTFSQLYSIFANSPLLLGDLRAIRNKLVSETKISSTPLFDVFCGKFKEKSLAVKFLKDNCGKCWNLSMESSFMTSLNHPNLVQLVGVSLDQKPSYIITEFTEEGSLLEYLHTDPSAIDISKLVTFAEDICNAAAYLEEMGLAHTELAAKNILLSGEGVKVSNVESAIRSGCERDMFLPVKWTAPEALKSGIFTNKSDVWSFGVVLWEIYSYGRHPYPDLVSDPQVVLNHFEKGKKLEYPDDCPHDISEIMTSCWCTKPEDRPTFSEMQRDFTSLTSSQAV